MNLRHRVLKEVLNVFLNVASDHNIYMLMYETPNANSRFVI